MRITHTYTVVPSLPERLSPLRTLAYNLRWSWSPQTLRLFQTLDAALWESSGHNPARILGLLPQSRIVELASDAAFLTEMDSVYADYEAYMGAETWWARHYAREFDADRDGMPDFHIAYFSAEFGITECLPIYSGGLGVLAGDHIKSASDLGLPLVGVGFLYQNGYFRQTLNSDGWQIENYPATDFYSLPIEPVRTSEGKPLTVSVDFPGRLVYAQIWRAQVGRVPLYLLDTNIAENNENDRHIAGNLYGGDNETRIQQEIVLGIGGTRALYALGIKPTVCHMNEGHSAFLSLERIRLLVNEKGLTFADAGEAAAAGNLFTTHTPVPAGFDKFPEELMRRYFENYAPTLSISFEEMLGRGRVNPGDRTEPFNMAALAFRQARFINGVSKLHGAVTREMIHPQLPDFPLDEVPVGSVTNGIHTMSFLSHEMAELFKRYLGDLTPENIIDPAYWARVDLIPDAELWAVRQTRRKKLVEWARQYQRGRYERRGASERELNESDEILDPDVFTIGFARRFATYKRGDLILRDADRLKRILNSTDKPVQIVFAGKAHPKDDGGKELIKRIVHFARNEDVRRRLVFLEDYEISMARYLTQGVDLWLNNPRRPMEASGTSGMKVVPNGGLNFSVLDGWWAEGYDPTVGWEIGGGMDYQDFGYQDHVEAQHIYEMLERDIVPLFYKRNGDVPSAWLSKVKTGMKKLAPVFTTIRMVAEYAETYYVPAARHEAKLTADDYAKAKSLIQWKNRVRAAWGDISITDVTYDADRVTAGVGAKVTAIIRMGTNITPDDVRVELYGGSLDADRNISDGYTAPLTLTEKNPAGGGAHIYEGVLPTQRSGQQGFSLRVVPFHEDAVLPQELPLIHWES